MIKKKIFVIIFLVIMIVLTGCSQDIIDKDDSENISVEKANIIVKTYNQNEEEIKADSIVLFNKKGTEAIKTKKVCNQIEKFEDIKTGEYRLVVGKREYEMYNQKIHITEDNTLKIKLNKNSNSYVNLEINVISWDKRSGLSIPYHNGYQWSETENGNDILKVWPGVIYDFQFGDYYDKEFSYDVIEKNNIININKENSSISVKLYNKGNISSGNEINQYKYNSEEVKNLDLGYLSKNEFAIVGITPANFNYLSNKDYKAKVDMQTESSLKMSNNLIYINDFENKKNITENNSNINNLKNNLIDKNQALIDNYQRNLEKMYIENDEKLYNNINKIQGLYSIGDKRKFKVSTSYNDEDEITAVLKGKSKRAYYFIDKKIIDKFENNVKEKEDLSFDKIINEFENIISTNIDYFSTVVSQNYDETSYDIDNNGKIIVLFTPLEGAGGYFSSTNFYNNDDSNKADMFYVNYQEYSNNKNLLSTMSHELQHLLFYIEEENLKKYKPVWINEAFSQLSEYLNEYNSSIKYTNEYFSNPSQESMMHWEGDMGGDYDATALFGVYLYNRFGKKVIKDIITSTQNPKKVISQNYMKFEDLFLDWTTTIYANNYLINEKYTLDNSFKTLYKPDYTVLNGIKSDEFNIKPNAVKFYRIEGNDSKVSLKFELNENTGITYMKFQK